MPKYNPPILPADENPVFALSNDVSAIRGPGCVVASAVA